MKGWSLGRQKDMCQESCNSVARAKLIRQNFPDEQLQSHLQELFSVVGDPTRFKIFIALMSVKELCVCDIATSLDVTVALASHHLRKLRHTGLLQHRNDGKLVFYSLAGGSLSTDLSKFIRRLASRRNFATQPAEERAISV